jgi:hypothetical protein
VADRKYDISEEERKRRSERMAEANRRRAEERRQARERGEEPPPKTKPDDDPVDIDLELRKVIRNPKATPQAKKDALRILHEREREERERARAERDSDALLARVQVDLRARVPPVSFEDQLERWREIALDHGFELKAVPIEEEEEIAPEPDELETEPDIEPEPAPIGAEAPEVEEELPATPEPAPRGNVVRWPVGPNEDPYAGLGPVGTGTPKGTAASGGYDHGVDSTLGERPYP